MRNGTHTTSRLGLTFMCWRAWMRAHTHPRLPSRWETIRWCGRTSTIKQETSISSWDIILSCFGITLLRRSSTIPLYGRLINDSTIPLCSRGHSPRSRSDYSFWTERFVACSRFLLKECRARPYCVCRAGVTVFCRRRQEEQLRFRIDDALG